MLFSTHFEALRSDALDPPKSHGRLRFCFKGHENAHVLPVNAVRFFCNFRLIVDRENETACVSCHLFLGHNPVSAYLCVVSIKILVCRREFGHLVCVLR